MEKNQVIFLSFCSLNAHLLWCSLIKTKTHTHTPSLTKKVVSKTTRALRFVHIMKQCYIHTYGIYTQKLIIIVPKATMKIVPIEAEPERWSLQSRYMLKFMISNDFQSVFFFFLLRLLFALSTRSVIFCVRSPSSYVHRSNELALVL